jgi:hypothetical protein
MSNTEAILLKYMENDTCDICRNIIKTDLCCVTCCHSLFHKLCIEKNQTFSLQCPRCERFYDTNESEPALTHLMNLTISEEEVYQLYHKIYHANFKDLRLIDHYLRHNMVPVQYHRKFIGYYKHSMFSLDISSFSKKWDDFTYGLFRNYDWAHTIATGEAVLTLATNPTAPLHSDQHIYIVIYNLDYRVVRKQLKILLSHIETIIMEPCPIYLSSGILTLCIPGMIRKICIALEYYFDPFWFLYRSKGFDTFGCFYNGNDVCMTVKAAVDPLSYQTAATSVQPILEYTKNYTDSIDTFSKKIKLGFIHGSEQLFRGVYMHYNLHIIEHGETNIIKKHFIQKLLSSDISDIVDVCHTVEDDTGKTMMEVKLISEDKKETIDLISVITLKEIKLFVKKVLYERMQNTSADVSDH